MIKLKYNIPNDTNTYIISCPNELLDMYMKLLFENGAYKVTMDTKVEFNNMEEYELFKNE